MVLLPIGLQVSPRWSGGVAKPLKKKNFIKEKEKKKFANISFKSTVTRLFLGFYIFIFLWILALLYSAI